MNPDSGSLSLRQAADGSFFCHGCLTVECRTLDDVRAVAEEAMKNRVVRAHALNQDSSRSHAIFTLAIDREVIAPTATNSKADLTDDDVAMRFGKISFVDLVS